MEDESLSSTDASSSYFDCGGGLPLSFTLPSTFDTAQLAGVDPPSTPPTATLLAAPTPSSKPVNYSLYHQTSSAHLTAMPTSGSPMSRACLSSMLHERRDTVTTAKHSMDALKTNNPTNPLDDKALMGVVCAINSMNATMNATRLSSVNLSAALELYATVIANPSPPPYSTSTPSPVEAGHIEARSMCFTHAAVFWMEWAAIQANLQLKLMQGLFKLKSLAEAAVERNRGVDINIEPRDLDALEADNIRSMVVRLTQLSHESFKEAYRKGADWNGVGGLNYWLSQVGDDDNAGAQHNAPPSPTASVSSDSPSTPPRSVASTAGLEAASRATRKEQEGVSLRRKHDSQNLRSSNKGSEYDSNSTHSKRAKPGGEPEILSSMCYNPNEAEGGLSDSSGPLHRSTLRRTKLIGQLSDSESDYGVPILSRYSVTGSIDDLLIPVAKSEFPSSSAEYKQTEIDSAGSSDIGLVSPSGVIDVCLADGLAMAAPVDLLREVKVANCNATGEEHKLSDNSETESGYTGGYVSAQSDKGCSDDSDKYFCDTIAQSAQEASRAQEASTCNQEFPLEDKEDKFYSGSPTGSSDDNLWFESSCPDDRSRGFRATHEAIDWQTIKYNPNTPDTSNRQTEGGYSPTSWKPLGENLDMSPEFYTAHSLPYAITEESTLKSTPPRIPRANALSLFSPITPPRSAERTERVEKVPNHTHIRRRGKFQKKNGNLQMLTFGEDTWYNADGSECSSEESVIPKGHISGGQDGRERRGAVDFGRSFGDGIFDLQKDPGPGYFSEDLGQRDMILREMNNIMDGEYSANSTNPRPSRLSRAKEAPQSVSARQLAQYVPQSAEPLGNLKSVLKYNCFGKHEADSE